MVVQAPFAVEQYMDKYETGIKYNMGETCVDSLTVSEVLDMAGEDHLTNKFLTTKLVYGHIKGSPELKEGIASLYNDPEITEKNIVITNGAIGGNFLALYSLVNPGDHVIAVDPTYQQLSSVPEVFGAKVHKFEVRMEDNYLPDMALLRLMIEENSAKLLIINNPNNPTGYVWENDVLAAITDLCKEFGTTLLCDEVYRPLFHFEPKEQIKSIVSFGYGNSIGSGSMSKALSLAGLRLGWLVTKNNEFLAQFYEKRDYNMISVLMLDDMVAAVALQNKDKILQRGHDICEANLALIEKFVAESNGAVEWIRPRGGSTCFLKINSAKSTMDLATNLAEEHGVLVVPGEVFGKPGWFRIGFGNSTSDVAGGLSVLAKVLGH